MSTSEKPMILSLLGLSSRMATMNCYILAFESTLIPLAWTLSDSEPHQTLRPRKSAIELTKPHVYSIGLNSSVKRKCGIALCKALTVLEPSGWPNFW